jgi:hypothetical protein
LEGAADLVQGEVTHGFLLLEVLADGQVH